MTRTITPVLCLLMVALLANPALAWLRPHYEDAVVVERSELIVVARLKPGTIQYVPHKKTPGSGASWEHHAVLVITEVLKGKCREKEIPIIIHYGLTPVVDGKVNRANFTIDIRRNRGDELKGLIEILDTGGSASFMNPFVKDAGKNNLWFLRKRSGTYGRKPGKGKYGIVDPEDLQPLELKDYFLAYLADNPENAVREYASPTLPLVRFHRFPRAKATRLANKRAGHIARAPMNELCRSERK